MSQTEFTEKLNVDSIKRQHVSQWELGDHAPNVKSLTAIMNAFNLPADYFWDVVKDGAVPQPKKRRRRKKAKKQGGEK